ncbi:MAG: ArsC family transcriptional regulator [Clostridia bacterium]|nr:ArsC family transcriptional regulator [Clostridiales bacterium]MBQ2976610.1 ArsC family transcriptional regulator [Clostridia bacterium]MDD6681553.1 ArsC family transcriptional regulator [Clostridiales bacterium]
MNIQIYALKRNFDTQKAERFFKERRISYQLLDLKKHKLGQRELSLFARRLGAENLVDRQSPDALSHPVAHTDDAAYILECLAENPRFLRTPIVRNGEQVTLGADEKTWEEWLKKG